MAEKKYLKEAKVVFKTLCQTLEHHDWRYKKDEEKLIVECGAQGEDLPMELTVNVDADRALVLLFSKMPFVVQEDKRLDLAVAVSAVNYILVDGCFDYDVASGRMYFRITNSFIDSLLGEDVLAYMLFCSCQTIDDYNDKFLMLAKGILSLEQFIASVKD